MPDELFGNWDPGPLEPGEHDLLVLPTLFCYRHWLELQVKAIIRLGQRWRDEL